MHRPTVDVYEAMADVFARRPVRDDGAARAFGAAVPVGRVRIDLGCGTGRETPVLGEPVVAVDAAHAMVSRVTATPLRVQADLEALPFRAGSLHGTWASRCYQHVPADRVPAALGDLHRASALGARLDLVVFERVPGRAGAAGATWSSRGDLPGRAFWDWPRQRLLDVVVGAGFGEVALATAELDDELVLHVTAVRERTLADQVGPGMRILLCGLNPSLYSADRGVGYARPGNRFWPAVRAAGLATVDRDARHLLAEHRIGTTDLVKRATIAASELSPAEFAAGVGRLERLCAWLRPGILYLVGLQGWRAAVDRRAAPGLQPTELGGAPVYVGPSTSGLNASTQLDGHVAHLRAAAAIADERLADREGAGVRGDGISRR